MGTDLGSVPNGMKLTSDESHKPFTNPCRSSPRRGCCKSRKRPRYESILESKELFKKILTNSSPLRGRGEVRSINLELDELKPNRTDFLIHIQQGLLI
jgi:hypothetical protein